VRALAILTLLLATASGARPAVPPPPASTPPTIRSLDVDTFAFSVEPERIILGETASATLRIVATGDDGRPLDVAPPTLTVSTGAIGAPGRIGPGVWTATFSPPKDAWPHVAIVAATIENGAETAVGFSPLPLWGKGQAAVSTKPHADVTVSIGADRFGPIRSNAAGDVLVPILVPPGPETAVARSVDSLGNESQKSISLGVPGFNRIAVVALEDVVTGDGAGRGRLLACVVDKKGAPLVGARLTAQASVGRLAAPVEVAPGVFEWLWQPGIAKPREATVAIALAGAPLSVAKVQLRVIAGAPTRAEIVLPRRGLAADDDPAVPVRLAVFDSGGTPVPFGAARVDVDHGRVEGASGDVTRQLTWVLPRSRERSSARLTVRTTDGAVLGTAELSLLPGRPAALRIEAPADVVADGTVGAPIVVTALDAAGNEVVPHGVVVEADGGRIIAPTLDVAARRLRALYVPAPRDDETVVEVEARLASLTSSAPLLVRPRDRPALLVGTAVGSSWGYGDVLAIGPELSVLLRLPIFDGAVHGGVTLAAHEGIGPASSAPFSAWRAWPVLLEAAWRPMLTPALGMHVGATGGLVVVDTSTGQGNVAARTVTPGLAGAVVVGLALRAGPGVMELDARVGGGAQLASDPAVPAMPLGAGLVLGYRFGL
jgi:hypothetical protein